MIEAPDILSWLDETKIANPLDKAVLQAGKVLFERKENVRAFISATDHLGLEGWSSDGFLCFYGRNQDGGVITHHGLWHLPTSREYRGDDISEIIHTQSTALVKFMEDAKARGTYLSIPCDRKIMVDNIQIFDRATDGGYHEAPWPAFYSCEALKPEVFADKMKELQDLYRQFRSELRKD